MLPVLPGTVPDSDMAIGEITQARMDKAWNYYQEMYDQPQDNIVPLAPTGLTATKE